MTHLLTHGHLAQVEHLDVGCRVFHELIERFLPQQLRVVIVLCSGLWHDAHDDLGLVRVHNISEL